MNGQMDKEVDWSRKYRHLDRSGEPEGSAKQNLLNLIQYLSPKISPLRVASVEMTTILLESVNGNLFQDLSGLHYFLLLKHRFARNLILPFCFQL
ncbi:hypothetical protein BCL90_5131 [Pedobacter alluvionis]|uniref:Uncharacterized protein n=1 Tax=Pedobacter alluvionis TaxID=475253 RepID=A0A497XN28_9SPHI|nr:hypothetical protein BCL90_5131 [Pedobacter alluvionis]